VRQLAFYSSKTQSGLLHAWDASKWDFLGDWITPHGSEDDPTSDVNILFNNAYLVYITSLAAKIAEVLGHASAAATYRADAVARAAAVNDKYYQPSSGAYIDLLQTHLVMPLASGVVPHERTDAAMAHLEAAIQKSGGHLDVGLTGNYFLSKLLTEGGRNDLMWTMTSQKTFPSYGYFLAQGYTSWPEKWDVEPCCADKVSKMHGCYNAVGLWFVEGLAGISVDFSRAEYPIGVRAGVDTGNLTWASGTRAAPQGLVHSSWAVADVTASSRFEHNLSLPANAAARVLIPAASASDVLEGGKPLPADVSVLGAETVNKVHYVALGVAAGEHAFSSSWRLEAE
jgi:alpha-L-rhamnosidase